MSSQTNKELVEAVGKYMQGNVEYITLKFFNRGEYLTLKREEVKRRMIVDKDIDVINMKVRSNNSLVFDNTGIERAFYEGLCYSINSIGRRTIEGIQIPMCVLKELKGLETKESISVWYDFEKERYGKNLINIFEYFCSFLDDVDINTVIYGKVKKIMSFSRRTVENFDKYQKSMMSWLMKSVFNNYQNNMNIILFKENLDNPLAFRYFVKFLKDVWEDTNNSDRKDLVDAVIVCLSMSFGSIQFTEPGYYMYKVFLLELKQKLIEFLKSDDTELILSPISETERQKLFKEAISLVKEKVDMFRTRAKRINSEYALYVHIKGKEIYDLIGKFVVNNQIVNISADLTYEKALKLRMQEVSAFVHKLETEIYNVVYKNAKKLSFFNDSIGLLTLLQEVQSVVVAPRVGVLNFVRKLLNDSLDKKFALILERLNNVTGSKLNIVHLYFVLLREMKSKKKNYMHEVYEYLLPAYAEFHGVLDIDSYRCHGTISLLYPHQVYFCKIAWLIAYDFCYNFFYLNGVGDYDDTILQECLLYIFEDLVLKNTTLTPDNFKNFVENFKTRCDIWDIPSFDWGKREVNCKVIFDNLVVKNQITKLVF